MIHIMIYIIHIQYNNPYISVYTIRIYIYIYIYTEQKIRNSFGLPTQGQIPRKQPKTKTKPPIVSRPHAHTPTFRPPHKNFPVFQIRQSPEDSFSR